MNDHIAKPIEMDKFFTTIALWVQPREAVALPPPEPMTDADADASREAGASLPERDADDAAQQESPPPPPMDAADALATLRQSLEAGDAGAHVFFTNQRAVLAAALGKKQCALLGEAIKQFDFEAALEALNGLPPDP
jgi:hypothetical protein